MHDKGYYHSYIQETLMPNYPTLIQGTDQIAAKNILIGAMIPRLRL